MPGAHDLAEDRRSAATGARGERVAQPSARHVEALRRRGDRVLVRDAARAARRRRGPGSSAGCRAASRAAERRCRSRSSWKSVLSSMQLDAGRREDVGAGHAREGRLHHRAADRVAVVVGVAEQHAVAVQRGRSRRPTCRRRRSRRSPPCAAAAPRPCWISAKIRSTSVWSPSGSRTGRLSKRWASSRASAARPSKRPTITRPLSAPRSAATKLVRALLKCPSAPREASRAGTAGTPRRAVDCLTSGAPPSPRP